MNNTKNSSSPLAQLRTELPPSRYTVDNSDGRAPKVGDVLELDQGFTSSDGLPMVLVYCRNENGAYIYSAEVYESELGDPIEG